MSDNAILLDINELDNARRFASIYVEKSAAVE